MPDLRRPFLYGAFFFSGAAGLIYESVWTRYLGLFVGHSAYAQVIVLTVFLGGLSIGALLVGQFAERVKQPLLWYAGAELAVGVIGLSFHDVFVAVTGAAQTALFPALAGGMALTAVKWAIASALILPPAVLLGTTFPFMTSGIMRSWPGRPGRTLSLLYFSNSLGAASGAILAGFVLVGLFGLPGTLLTAAVVNVAVALVTWGVARASAPSSTPSPSGIHRSQEMPAPVDQRIGAEANLWRLLLTVSFATALASFIYEIAWIRMLSLVLGSATHSFEIMLSSFIFGLSLGAFFIQRRADDERRALRTLGAIQWCMGAAALATLPVYLMSFDWLGALMGALGPTDAGYRLFSLGKYGLASAVMLPSTFCAGMTLPLITRILLGGPQGERAVGWVYGINTLGSIAGVVLASMVLLPVIGLKPLLIVGAVLDMLLGVLLLRVWETRQGRRPKAAIAAFVGAAAMVTVVSVGTSFDTNRLNSGVFRDGRVSGGGVVTYWHDGRTASVAVTSSPGFRTIATNGKPDASLSDRWIDWLPTMSPGPLQNDEPTQVLLSLITLAHNPDARDGLVIGHGSGMSAHILLGDPGLVELVTVEIEPTMIEGSRAFLPANVRTFDDPRSLIVIGDAKSYFASSQRSFDFVLSEPSNPWVSGVSSLFTQEFYQLVSRHLAPGGVFGQWLHLYEIDDRLVLSVLAALDANFPSYELFRVHGADILIVASNEERLPQPDWTVADLPGIASDLQRTYPMAPEYLERTRFLSRAALAPLLERTRHPNSDYFPILDLGAEGARYRGNSARGIGWASDADFDPSDVFLSAVGPNDALGRTPIRAIRAFAALDLGTRIRRALVHPPAPAELDMDPELRQALSDEGALEGLISGGVAPPDWGAWMDRLRVVSGRRHGGLRGWADDEFFDRMTLFARHHGAPAGLMSSLVLERALRAHDWEAVASAAVQLVPEGRPRGGTWDAWVDAQTTLDGGVMALIMTGRVGEARRVFDTLAPSLSGPDTDFMRFLLPSYLEYAEAGGRFPAGRAP